METSYDPNAPKCSVEMTLNEDLVRQARTWAPDLSAQVERLLAVYVAQCEQHQSSREARLDDAISAWNAFDADHGAFADDYIDL